MTWRDDPTDRLTLPDTRPGDSHTHYHYPPTHAPGLVFTLVVFLTFVLGAGSVLIATFSLADSVERLLAIPMCQEAK